MTARFAVFAQDRSARWILVPGVASTRQIEIRNESDDSVECHLRVEHPPTASASPAVLTIQPHHTRTADIIFLANWSPQTESSLLVSLRDQQGHQLATFGHELVAADSSDCALALDLKEPVIVEGKLAGFKLWFSIASKSPTPRRFEIDFVRHPSLRFPERTAVTLAAGEATAFEVPVEWNRAVRDLQFWNHPLKIEAFVPASHGRRTAVLAWETVERRLDKYLSDDDRIARIVPVQPQQRVAAVPSGLSPGQLKYTELLELKKLEQAVVGAAPARVPVRPAEQPAHAKASARWSAVATLGTMAFAVVGLVLAALFFLRPPVVHPATAPVHVAPPDLPTAVITMHKVPPRPKHLAGTGPIAKPVWTSVAVAEGQTVAGVDSSQEQAHARAPAAPAPAAVALAPVPKPVHHVAVNRNAVVSLNGVDAAYAAGGRAVSVAWSGSAQAGATVQVLDYNGKIIASRDVPGNRSSTTIRLPRGYHGSVSVQVIALGYHGERVVQSAFLTPRG